MAQDKQKSRKEVRKVNHPGHASVPSHLSQGENAESPIANKKDTGDLGNNNPVPPGSSQQHHAVTAQHSQYLVSPGARLPDVSHLSPVNNLNTGTQHVPSFSVSHNNQHPLPDPFSEHNVHVHSHIAGAPHRHHHGQQNHQQQNYQEQNDQEQNDQEQNQHPIANPLDGYAFHTNVAGASHHYGAPNQVSLPNGYGSNTVPNVAGAPHYQQSAQSALHQPANASQSANYGNIPMASGFSHLNQHAANNFKGVAVQHYAYAEELQYMGSVQALPVSQGPNYFQGVPVQHMQYQNPQQPQRMGILQGNAASQPNNFQSAYPNNVSAAHSNGFQFIPAQHYQLSRQPQPGMNMAQGVPAAHLNNTPAAHANSFPAAHPNSFPAAYHTNVAAAHQTGFQLVPPEQHHMQLSQQPQPMDMVQPIPVADIDPLDLGIPQDQHNPITPGPPHPQANHPAVLALEDIDPDQDINEIIDAAASVLHADHRQCQHKWVEDDVEHQCTGHA
ncbi:uncharacterized protein B0T23DRAFT_428206 [Neurospora hispaniola]|uniref:Uncharacterized protein n=1 Tax=Neurospora hispaniola TaxID=588809 RepID=A0AAJ0IB24_9PEZI|nr:hypothetical protein B0T23DRAFT_428206 [Neurospora hispaniola]